MRHVGTSTAGPLGGWLGARTAVRHPVGWWLVWVAFAAGVNVAAAILATSSGNPTPEVPPVATPEVGVGFDSPELLVRFDRDFTGTWVVATGELPAPPVFEVTGPNGRSSRFTGAPGKEPNTWRVPEDAVPRRAPGEKYIIVLLDQDRVRVTGHKRQEIRFAPGPKEGPSTPPDPPDHVPEPQVFVKEFTATKPTVEPTERDVKFVATLSSPAAKMLVLKVTLAGAGKEWAEAAKFGNGGMEIRIEKGDDTGSVSVPLRDRTKMAQPTMLLARLDVPADHRAPGDANPREAQTRLNPLPPPGGTDPLPRNIQLIVQSEGKGELTFDLGNPKEQPRTVDLSLSPPATRPVKVNLQYEGDAKVDQHFRVTETDNPKQLTIPPGGKKTVVFEAVRGSKMALQPDRKVKVTFVPIGDVEVPEGSHVQLAIRENLKARRLLILVLAPADGNLVLPGNWAEHLAAWEKDENAGRDKWARAFMVGGKLGDGKLTPDITPLVGGQEVKIHRVADADGKERSARLNELLKLALEARQSLLKDLDAASEKEVRTVVVWRSNRSPDSLQTRQPIQPLPLGLQEELKGLNGRFGFVWFGGSAQRHEKDAALNQILGSLLQGWPGATAQLHPAIRFVEPGDTLDDIPTWLKSKEVLDLKGDAP